MYIIRSGNDIDVVWRIFSRDGSRLSLDDAKTDLWLISGPFKKRIESYNVSGHIVSFTVDADELTRYGIYKLQLSILDGDAETEDATFDVSEVFQIVSRTYDVTATGILDGTILLTPASVLNNIVSSDAEPGKSAYEIAVEHGFSGTEEQWLESLSVAADVDINEEDLNRDADNVIQFADRVYNAQNPDGMGYVILRKNKTFAEQVTKENTIYEVRYSYDLKGETVTVPAGSTLKFVGGKLSNGVLKADDIQIEAGYNKIFDNIKFEGACIDNMVVKLEWFVDNYLNSFALNTTVCAASQIEEALNCGAVAVSIGYGRYYPLQRTVEYTGTVDLIAENNARIHRSEGRGDIRSSGTYLNNYIEPCVYSSAVVTLLDYNYYIGTAKNSYEIHNTKRHGLTIEGWAFRCIKPYTDLSEKEVPIVKVTSQSNLVGFNFDCVVSATDRSITVNKQDAGYYISTATASSAYIPNYTGLEVATNGGYMTFITIGGFFYSVFNGVKFSRGSGSTNWMTSLILNADMWCVRGMTGSTMNPVIARGQMQPLVGFATGNSEAFLQGTVVFVQGFVWDIGLSSNGISRCNYAARIIADADGPGNYISIQQPSSAIWDNNIGLRQDRWNYPNLLNGLQTSSYRHAIFKENNGYVNYLVSTDGENFVDIFSADCFTAVYNQQNLFGIPSFFHEYTSRALMGGEHPYAYINTSEKSEYIYFKVAMQGRSENLSSSIQGKRILVKFDAAWHRDAHIKIVNTSTSAVSVDEDIALVPIYKNFYYQMYSISPNYFNVEITWRVRATINGTYGYFRLKDETGVVYVSGLTSTPRAYGAANDNSYAKLKLSRGDEVTIRCYKGSSGAVYAWYATGAEPDESVVKATVEEFIAAPASDSQVYELTGNIIGYWTSSDAVDPLPTIYMPNVHSQYHGYYSTSILPKHPANSYGYNGEKVYLTSFNRPYYRNGINYFDSDGFTPARKRGTTAQRPTFESSDSYAVGFQYFDTSLGKWIYWTGNDWVNMDGTSLTAVQ